MAYSSPFCTRTSSAASSSPEGGGEFTSPISLYIKRTCAGSRLHKLQLFAVDRRRAGPSIKAGWLKRYQCTLTRKRRSHFSLRHRLGRDHEKIKIALTKFQ